MSMSPLDRAGPWTLDDLLELPRDGRRYEVVDGVLLVSPRETLFNDRVATRLFRQLDRQVPPGVEAVLDTYLRLGTDGRVPDVGLVVADVPVPRRQIGHDPEHYLLAVEVVSPSSRKNDRFFKPVEYAAAGVPAYWRIETEPDVVLHVHLLVNGHYELVQQVRGLAQVEVPFPMTIDVPALVPPVLEG